MKPSEIAEKAIDDSLGVHAGSDKELELVTYVCEAYLRLREAADRVVGSMGEAWAILEKELEETDESGG